MITLESMEPFDYRGKTYYAFPDPNKNGSYVDDLLNLLSGYGVDRDDIYAVQSRSQGPVSGMATRHELDSVERLLEQIIANYNKAPERNKRLSEQEDELAMQNYAIAIDWIGTIKEMLEVLGDTGLQDW